jgi:Caspase domain
MSFTTQGIVLTALFLSLFADTSTARVRKPNRLALLIAAPWSDETAMHNDLVSVEDALSQRGYSTNQIMRLEGNLNRQSLLLLLREASRRIAKWKADEVFFYFSGHGFFSGSTATEARPGVLLASDPEYSSNVAVFWDEVFTTLNVPAKVNLFILPDN